jgi:hypothetical protein
MLTLDALEPGELTVEDKALLRLMAGVLAVALSVPSRGERVVEAEDGAG